MNANSFPDQGPPPPLSTGIVDRINFAIQFEKYRDIILKRWWILALSLALSVAYGGYKTYGKPDIFAARGSMMVRPQVNLQQVGGNTVGEMENNFFGTQVRLMQSAQVVGAAQAKLKDYARKFTPPASASLSVYQERNTSIFALSATGTSPEYAQRFLDQVMHEYIDYKRRVREESAENAAFSVNREVRRQGLEVTKVEQELFDFQKQNNMAYFEGQADVATQKLMQLKQRLADLHTELSLLATETAEQQMERLPLPIPIEPGGTPSASMEGGNVSTNQTSQTAPVQRTPKNLKLQSNMGGIKDNIAMLKSQLEERSHFLKPKHPVIIQLTAQIRQLEELLAIAKERTKEQIDAYRDSLVKEQESLNKEIPGWQAASLEANQKATQFAQLKTNVARAKELYDTLLKQLKTIDMSQSTSQEMIAISEPATASPVPIGPNRTKEMLTAVLAGLAIAIGIIVLLERFDDRVKTVEELQDMVQETVLGQVPMLPAQNGGGPLLMSNLPAHNTFSEAFRNVRSSLMFSPIGGQARTIAVTSAIPGDGKTTCSVNLSICLAQIEGGRTLLIDADMRKMNIHRYFNMENGHGLSEVLSGQKPVEECLFQTGVSNLDLLRAGAPPPNPGELLLSGNFKELMERLKGSYHRIIIDTPPVLATDDTLSMAPGIDGVVFVVKANQTSLRFVNNSMNSLKQRGAKVFGLILNQIDTNSAQHYYYYYYSNYYHSQAHKQKA